MARTDCDGAIRNIEKEILRECHIYNVKVYPDFLNFYIKLLTLDPSWGIFSNFMTNRSDVQTFIKFVVRNLHHQTAPAMITLKMQTYMRCNYESRFKILKSYKLELGKRLKTIEDEILREKDFNNVELDILIRRIVFYICLASGIGNPIVESVYKEVKTAFGSIVSNEGEMLEFLQAPRYMKEEALQEFVKLVTGVRIFNKDCGKGGEGMEDLPMLLNEANDNLQLKLQLNLIDVMNVVNLLTTGLDTCIQVVADEREDYRAEWNLPNDVTSEDLENVKSVLVVYRQVELYLRTMLDDINKEKILSQNIFEKLQSTLILLHQIVSHRIAIPVGEVFPPFVKLSEIYTMMQDQTVIMAKVTLIMGNVLEYARLTTFSDHVAHRLLGSTRFPMTDAERSARHSGTIPILNNDYTVSQYSAEELAKLKIECLGFCPWILTKCKGVLLPGNADLGVLNVLNMNFVFSSVEAATAFARNPQKGVMSLITFIRKRPEMINLLNLKEQMVAVQEIVQLVREPPLKPLTAEKCAQTETHFVKDNIDPNYFWNIWDLKRLAIQTANITHCKTVGSQTMKSFHRMGIYTQTYQKRVQSTQTRKDNYSNVPTLSNFIYGLRGRKDNKQFIIELTRPVHE